MRASHQDCRRYPATALPALSLRSAAEACGFRVLEATDSFAQLRGRVNWWSYGERIEVHASEIDGDVVVRIVSRCVSPIQIEDWGRNRKNVRRLFEALDRQRNLPHSAAVPICPACGYVLVVPESQQCPECGAAAGAGTSERDPSRQKVRHAAVLVVVVTAVEVGVLIALQRFGRAGLFFKLYGGPLGAIQLLLSNAVVLFGILLLAQLWKPKSHR